MVNKEQSRGVGKLVFAVSLGGAREDTVEPSGTAGWRSARITTLPRAPPCSSLCSSRERKCFPKNLRRDLSTILLPSSNCMSDSFLLQTRKKKGKIRKRQIERRRRRKSFFSYYVLVVVAGWRDTRRVTVPISHWWRPVESRGRRGSKRKRHDRRTFARSFACTHEITLASWRQKHGRTRDTDTPVADVRGGRRTMTTTTTMTTNPPSLSLSLFVCLRRRETRRCHISCTSERETLRESSTRHHLFVRANCVPTDADCAAEGWMRTSRGVRKCAVRKGWAPPSAASTLAPIPTLGVPLLVYDAHLPSTTASPSEQTYATIWNPLPLLHPFPPTSNHPRGFRHFRLPA